MIADPTLTPAELAEANAQPHPVPWECPEHGEASLFSKKAGLYCGICADEWHLHKQIASERARAEAAEAEARVLREQLADYGALVALIIDGADGGGISEDDGDYPRDIIRVARHLAALAGGGAAEGTQDAG